MLEPAETYQNTLEITFPSCYKYIETSPCTFRSSLCSVGDVSSWIKEYSLLTNTNWIVKKNLIHSTRFICRKIFVCHHSSFRRVLASNNKKGKSKNLGCTAEIEIVIKLTTRATKNSDIHVRNGFPAIIRMKNEHSHAVGSSDALSCLRATEETREQFLGYFEVGLSITEAMHLHKSKLALASDEKNLNAANTSINPKYRTVSYWYDCWRWKKLGPCIREDKALKDCLYGVSANSQMSFNEPLVTTIEKEKQTTCKFEFQGQFSYQASDKSESVMLPCQMHHNLTENTEVNSINQSLLPNNDTNKEENELFQQILQLVNSNFKKFRCSHLIFREFKSRLELITTATMWERFLAAAGTLDVDTSASA